MKQPKHRGILTVLSIISSLLVCGIVLASSVSSVSTPAIVISHDWSGGYSYDYAPTVLKENGIYKVWWCGTGPQGQSDYIWYSTATNLNGPWSTIRTVFGPTVGSGKFDEYNSCDPDIIHIGSTYYMYYGGEGNYAPGKTTQLGVATSADGINWVRQNNGNPIIGPKDPQNGLAYGVGQPSVVYWDGWYYIVYTTVWMTPDPQIPGAMTAVGAEFVVRSADPLFQNNVQEKQTNGWTPIPDRAFGGTLQVVRNTRLLGDKHNMSLTFLRNQYAFMLIDTTVDVATLYYFDGNFNTVWDTRSFNSTDTRDRGIVRDGSGLVSQSAAQTYNVEMLAAQWKRIGDKNNIFYYDLGRQTFRLNVP